MKKGGCQSASSLSFPSLPPLLTINNRHAATCHPFLPSPLPPRPRRAHPLSPSLPSPTLHPITFSGHPSMPLIRIHSHTFQISSPYSTEEKPVGQKELAALDRLRAENIRNNMAKQMDKEGNWPLVGQALAEFEARVEVADQEYEFPEQQAVAPARKGTFDKEVEKIAEDLAWQHLQQKAGIEPTAVALQELARKLAKEPDVQAEARRRLEVRSEVALSAIEDLL